MITHILREHLVNVRIHCNTLPLRSSFEALPVAARDNFRTMTEPDPQQVSLPQRLEGIMEQNDLVALLGSAVGETASRQTMITAESSTEHTECCRTSRTSTDERRSGHRYRRSLQACIEPSACGVKETSDEVSILIQRSSD